VSTEKVSGASVGLRIVQFHREGLSPSGPLALNLSTSLERPALHLFIPTDYFSGIAVATGGTEIVERRCGDGPSGDARENIRGDECHVIQVIDVQHLQVDTRDAQLRERLQFSHDVRRGTREPILL